MKKRNFSFTIIILTVALVLVGVAFLPRLPIKLNPGRNLPVINVSFSMKDAASRVVPRLVALTVESDNNHHDACRKKQGAIYKKINFPFLSKIYHRGIELFTFL